MQIGRAQAYAVFYKYFIQELCLDSSSSSGGNRNWAVGFKVSGLDIEKSDKMTFCIRNVIKLKNYRFLYLHHYILNVYNFATCTTTVQQF